MTTIAIDDDAQRRLLHMKEDLGLRSMNEVVHRLLDQAVAVPDSMFGVHRGLRGLDRKTRNDMWEE